MDAEPSHNAAEPPLSIAHILLWTTGIAVAATVNKFLDPYETKGAAHGTLEFLAFAIDGLMLSIVVLYAGRLARRSGPMPSAGGHWLAVAAGLGFVVWIAGQSLWLIQQRRLAHGIGVPATLDQLVLATLLSARVVIMIGCAIGTRRNPSWWIVFAAEVLTSSQFAAIQWANAGFHAGWWIDYTSAPWHNECLMACEIAGLVALAIGAGTHFARRGKEPGDWLHWTVIAALAIERVVRLAAIALG